VPDPCQITPELAPRPTRRRRPVALVLAVIARELAPDPVRDAPVTSARCVQVDQRRPSAVVPHPLHEFAQVRAAVGRPGVPGVCAAAHCRRSAFQGYRRRAGATHERHLGSSAGRTEFVFNGFDEFGVRDGRKRFTLGPARSTSLTVTPFRSHCSGRRRVVHRR
jgi:hypothetical protein